MALPSNGYIEINDTNSNIRGMMAGARGTFSGTFSSVNVDAVQNVNIRDGAVNAFYGFNFPKGSTSISFTVPHQPFARVLEIMLPIEVYEYGRSNGSGAVITVYKNGVLFKQATIAPVIGGIEGKYWDPYFGSDGDYVRGVEEYFYAWYLQTARIMDFGVTGAATYTITFSSWKGNFLVGTRKNGYYVEGEISLTFQGQVTVGFRKR